MGMTNEEKEYLISKALESEEGRSALAQAMAKQNNEIHSQDWSFKIQLNAGSSKKINDTKA